MRWFGRDAVAESVNRQDAKGLVAADTHALDDFIADAELLRFHGPDGAMVSAPCTFPIITTDTRGVAGSLVVREISCLKSPAGASDLSVTLTR